ncbi:MAG: glycoside hydrolase family 105 protein [Paludibacteraceae bacterium]
MIRKVPYLLLLLLFSLAGCSAKSKVAKTTIQTTLNKSAQWQIENFKYPENNSSGYYLHDYGLNAWTNAVFYIGLLDWAKTTENETYLSWLYEIGEKSQWKVANNFSKSSSYDIYHADELCMGQFYLDMYRRFNEQKMSESSLQRIDSIIKYPPRESMSIKNKQKWTWCDALFMASPVYAKAAEINENSQYLDYMHQEFMDTYNYLYDKEYSLFYRDDSYMGKKEKNGEKVFWGRGNGWVVAGIVQILKEIPETYEHRPFYENLLKEMLISLVKYQSKDGFWHASLLDPDSYPSPETSATSLITYAIAYAINNDILPDNKYLKPLGNSWHALVSVVDTNGKLGFVQPIGADPRKVTKEMTAVYGIGAFLMAGTEMYKLSERY